MVGSGVPSISTSKGGFEGSVRTDFGYFSTRTDARQDESNGDYDSQDEDEDEESYRSPSGVPKRRNWQRLRYSSNVDLL